MIRYLSPVTFALSLAVSLMLGCVRHTADFRPALATWQELQPSCVCLPWAASVQNMIVFENVRGLHVPLFADSPIEWEDAERALVLSYRDGVYKLAPKDHNGWPPKMTDRYLTYVGEDEHSVLVYDLVSGARSEYDVDSRITNIMGTTGFFLLGVLPSGVDYIVYWLDPATGLTEIGRLQSSNPLFDKLNVQVADRTMYVLAGTNLFRCSSAGMVSLCDLAGTITVTDPLDDALTIEAIHGGDITELLLRLHGDYWALRVRDGTADITDTFTLRSRVMTKPPFAYFDGRWVTCLNGRIMARDAAMGFLSLAELPEDVASDSSTEALHEIPDNFVIRIFAGCDQELVLVTTRGLVVFDKKAVSFSQFRLVQSPDEKLGLIAQTARGLILGTDKGRYFALTGD